MFILSRIRIVLKLTCQLILQPPSKAGEIALIVDVSSNEYSFLKTTRIDDLPTLPYAAYLVRFLINYYLTHMKINKSI